MSDILNSLLNQKAQQQSWFNSPVFNPQQVGQGTVLANTQPLAAADTPSFMDSFLGWEEANGTKHNGWGMPALGAASSLFNSWIGLEQLGIAKKSLSEQKRQFDMNWDAQRTSTNRQLADRQEHRAAFNPDATEDTASYMAKWGIK